jgi:hypothetical protein
VDIDATTKGNRRPRVLAVVGKKIHPEGGTT